MKIYITCESRLLQKSLEYYLKEFLVDDSECEFIITDRYLKTSKPTCLISTTPQAHIPKPFTPQILFKKIQEFYEIEVKKTKKPFNLIPNLLPKELRDIQDPELQSKINSILKEFSIKIHETLQENKNS